MTSLTFSRRSFSQCVFCGETMMSAEHVVGRWASRDLLTPSPDPVLHIMSQAGRELASWESDQIDIQVKAPCEKCNNGWMSRLEKQAQRLIRPMLDGAEIQLGWQEQVTLSTWSVKTLMMYQLFHPADSGVPQGHYRALYLDRSRPPGIDTRVWISRYDPTDDVGRYYGSPLRRTPKSPPEGQIGVFNVGQAMFVAYVTSAAELTASNPQPALLEIWPARKKSIVTWPPPGGLCYDDQGFHGIVDAMGDDAQAA